MDLKVDDQYWTVTTVELVAPKDSPEEFPILEVEVTLERKAEDKVRVFGVRGLEGPEPEPLKFRGRTFDEALGRATCVIALKREGMSGTISKGAAHDIVESAMRAKWCPKCEHWTGEYCCDEGYWPNPERADG